MRPENVSQLLVLAMMMNADSEMCADVEWEGLSQPLNDFDW